jgi:hypothetical protein
MLIDKQVVKREEGRGAMDNDYLTPVLVNKQVAKREEGGRPWTTIVYLTHVFINKLR